MKEAQLSKLLTSSRGGNANPRVSSHAFAEAMEWLMGHIPQIRSTDEGIS